MTRERGSTPVQKVPLFPPNFSKPNQWIFHGVSAIVFIVTLNTYKHVKVKNCQLHQIYLLVILVSQLNCTVHNIP